VPAGFGRADYTRCLAALIDELELGPAHVAGISWGSTVVQELYRHHPEPTATLILVETYAGWMGSPPEEEIPARVAGVRQIPAAPDGAARRAALTPRKRPAALPTCALNSR
jgi:pimeloyl-ACP methyl ester carboxylesterase